MLLDGFVVFILIVWVVLGWRAGAAVQAVRLGAAVAAFVAAAPLSSLARQIVFGERAVSTPLVEAASLCTAGISVYILCRLLGALLVRAMRAASDALTWLDHVGGAWFGALKALVAGYFLVSVVYIGTGALAAVDPKDDLHIRDSVLLTGVERYNVIVPWQLSAVGTLQEALSVGLIARETDQWAAIAKHPAAEAFLRRERVQSMLSDGSLARAAYHGEYATVLADSDVRACLSERPCRSSLKMTEWSELRESLEPEGGLALDE